MFVIPESRSDIRDPVPMHINAKKTVDSRIRWNDGNKEGRLFPYADLAHPNLPEM
jgi:hypothetical protein